MNESTILLRYTKKHSYIMQMLLKE